MAVPPPQPGRRRLAPSVSQAVSHPQRWRWPRPRSCCRCWRLAVISSSGSGNAATGLVATASGLAAAALPAAAVAVAASPAWAQSDLWGSGRGSCRPLSPTPLHCCPAMAVFCLHQQPIPLMRQQPLRREAVDAAAAGPGAGPPDCRSRQQPRRRPRRQRRRADSPQAHRGGDWACLGQRRRPQ